MGAHRSVGRRVAAVGLTVVLILQTGTWVPPAAAGTDAPAESKAEDQSRAPVAPASEPSGPQQASFSDAFERLYFTTARYNPLSRSAPSGTTQPTRAGTGCRKHP